MAMGMPRREGLSRCSTDAKKASMSMWMILRNSIGCFYKVNDFLGKGKKRKLKNGFLSQQIVGGIANFANGKTEEQKEG